MSLHVGEQNKIKMKNGGKIVKTEKTQSELHIISQVVYRYVYIIITHDARDREITFRDN